MWFFKLNPLKIILNWINPSRLLSINLFPPECLLLNPCMSSCTSTWRCLLKRIKPGIWRWVYLQKTIIKSPQRKAWRMLWSILNRSSGKSSIHFIQTWGVFILDCLSLKNTLSIKIPESENFFRFWNSMKDDLPWPSIRPEINSNPSLILCPAPKGSHCFWPCSWSWSVWDSFFFKALTTPGECLNPDWTLPNLNPCSNYCISIRSQHTSKQAVRL